jgi:hypothetical protein
MCYILCTKIPARRWILASSLHHPLVQRQPKLMFGPPDGRTLCHNCITTQPCRQDALVSVSGGRTKGRTRSTFEVYRCTAVGLIAQSCFTAMKNKPCQCSTDAGREIFFPFSTTFNWAEIAESVWRLATDWKVQESNPGGERIFRTRPGRPWDPPSLLYNG